jgi:hypothetical protein
MADKIDPAALDADGLIAAVREIERTRDESLALSGRVLAELHDRCGLSWPAVERATGVPRSTAHRRAEPFLRAPEDES